MIIDGKKIALKIYDEIKKEVSSLKIAPTLGAILVGDNSSSLRYIKQKQKWAEYVGINFDLKTLPKDIKEDELLEVIKNTNEDKSISGYIVQLPLPESIDTKKIIRSMSALKDIDGFTPENIGRLSLGDDSGMIPCTPAGIMRIIKEEDIELKGKFVVVIGRSNIVGKPITSLLLNAGATVINCNSKTKDIEGFTKNADIVIIATGKPELLKIDMINSKTVVIDVGFSVVNGEIYGDACFKQINDAGNKITPVPGGVGPLTVAYLMKNTLKAKLQESN